MKQINSNKARKAIAALKSTDISGYCTTRDVCYKVGREYQFIRDIAYQGTITLKFSTLNAAIESGVSDEENEVARYTFEYKDGEDATYIILYRASGYGHTDRKWAVDAEWSDGPAGMFDHLPTGDEVKAIHDNYIESK